MKAYTHTKYGPPEVLRLDDIPDPAPGDNEVLIRIHATTVNRTDNGFLRADPFIARFFTGLFSPKHHTPGSEFAGKVEATGSDVSLFKTGDRVFGFSEFGAHAEYITMNENGPLETIPGNLTYEEAAPLTEGAHYALNIIRAAKVREGQRILVYGATGAIGSALVQLLKAIDAEVTAVCNTGNVELVRSLGADEVIDYEKQDFTATDKTFDAVFDAVGKSSFGRCKQLLKKRGIYVSTDLGYMAQNPLLALITPLLGGRKVLFPIPRINQEIVQYIKELTETGKFKPVIDRRYSFELLVEAYNYVATGRKTGNVVITVR